MDKYEITINSLRIHADRWKEMFECYCGKVGDKSKTIQQRAKYASKAEEAYIIYSELSAKLFDILSINNSEEES